MDPESLFCLMLQNVYTSIIALIEGAMALPLIALQILESALQMVEFVTFAAIDIALTAIEQIILKLFDLENVSLENARRNFCKIAYDCVALTNYLFGPNSPLESIYTQTELAEMKANYSKFEETVCQGSFKSLLDQFKAMALTDIMSKLNDFIDKIHDAETKIEKLKTKYNKALQDSGIYEVLNKLDEYANCAFTACDFITEGEDKQSETLDKLKLEKDGENYSLNASLMNGYNKMQSSLMRRIGNLQQWSAHCADKKPNPNAGIPLDKLA